MSEFRKRPNEAKGRIPESPNSQKAELVGKICRKKVKNKKFENCHIALLDLFAIFFRFNFAEQYVTVGSG